MTHKQIFEKFKEMFPIYIHDGLVWFMNGRNSIRIRGVDTFHFDKQDVVFTINNKGNEWRLESLDNYMARTMKGE